MSFIGTSIIQNGEIAPLANQKPTGVEKEIYEVFRVENGKALFLNDHLQRFARSIDTAGIKTPLAEEKIRELLEWLIVCNPSTNANIRLSLLPDGFFQAGFIRSKYPDAQMYAQGVKCLLIMRERTNPSAKIYQKEMRQQAESVQKEQSAYETVLVNHEGRITEGSRSNIFFVKGDTLITAPSELVLEGIMRSKVLDCAKISNVKVEFSAIDATKLNETDAAFITGTSPRILPISNIDDFIFDVNNNIMRRLMVELNNIIKTS